MSKAVLTKHPDLHASGQGNFPTLPRRSTLRLIRPKQLNERVNRAAAEQFLRQIVNACASNVAVLDESTTILYASEAWQLFEQTFVNPTGKKTAPFSFELFRACGDAALDKSAGSHSLSQDLHCLIADRQKEFHGEYSYHAGTGLRHLLVHVARLNLPGSGFRILITHEDLSSPQEELRKSEERLSHLLDTTKIIAWDAEPEAWTFTYVSEQAGNMLGYPVTKWYEPDFFSSHIHPSDRKHAFATCLKQSRAVDSFDLTFRMTAKDGSLVWVHHLVSVTRKGGKPVSVHGFMIDITERNRAQETLRDLSGRLIVAQEEERSRVARELHDDLNQRMALLSIELAQLEPEIEKPLALRSRVRKLQGRVREISADIHRLSYQLHPSKLDHLGLAAAVQSLCKELSEGQKLRVEFHQEGFPSTLPKDVTLCVFRIAQEALRNSVKYSGASLAKVTVKNTGAAIHLTVSDDGCGFDMKSDAMQKGLGFTSMRERLRIVDGAIEIHSQPRRGTVVEVFVPLVRENRNTLM